MPSIKKNSKPGSGQKSRPVRAGVPSRPSLPTHSFELFYPGDLDDIGDPGINALYEAGLADATIRSRGGEITISLDRVAPFFRIALLSAICDVEKAGLGLELIRVEPVESLT